jgi:hypothetical protein
VGALIALRRLVEAEPLIWPKAGSWAGVRPGLEDLRDDTLVAAGGWLMRDVSIVYRLQMDEIMREAQALIGAV